MTRGSHPMSEEMQLSEGAEKVAVDLLIESIGELATSSVLHGPAHGESMSDVARIKNAALAVKDGKISLVGPRDEVLKRAVVDEKTTVVDASHFLVTPGLVDPHTHLIFAGNRADEFIMRCQGKSYTEIAAAGGGIVSSMRATRHATVDELVHLGSTRIKKMLESGTTTVEVKTGYGLDVDSELRMLEAIYRLQRQEAIEIVPTFMAAHAIPPGMERDRYVRQIVEDMLPRVVETAERESEARSDYHGETKPFVDVFCDRGYFTLEDTRQILEASIACGLKTKVHADEFVNLGGTRLAVELGAASADHLLNVTEEEIRLLADSRTIAVLLPGTSFYLNLSEHAPARKMIEDGVAVALGSDFNPGSC
ncbi:MAG TPA: imidazolonepropionase, partial [Candidatus Obscuribacterales bacterium]